MEDTIRERVKEFQKKKASDCRAALLAEAEQIVDSLLLHEALREVTDSLKRLRPFKPLPPVSIPPIDSTGVEPIFE